MTGIGFIGAGSIIKLSEEHLVHRLTASARVWTGIAIGLGQIGIALITAILTILVVAVVAGLERWSQSGRANG